MAYLGNNTDHNAEVFTTTKDRFSGNASTTAFTLSAVPANAESMQVYVNNVRQDSGRAYTVSGTTLTFTEAPSSATGNIYVVFNSVIAGIHQVITANTQLRTDVVTPHAISNTSTYSVGELLVAGQITVSGGDTAAGDNAALGYTAAEGLILTGQGSTSDITIKNDADADVITIATGGTNVDIVGDITAATVNADGDTSAGDNAAIGYTAAEGLILTGQGSTSDITLKNDAAGTVCYVPTGADDLRFPDNAKLELGSVADLQIYHDASDSYIAEGGTGALKIRASDLRLENANGSETYAILAGDGAVSLYYDNAVKFATASGGVTITGAATVSGLTTSDTMKATSRLFIGDIATSVSVSEGQQNWTQSHDASNRSGATWFSTHNSAGGAETVFAKGRSGSIGSYTIVQSGDTIGTLSWCGDDGTNMNSVAARILGAVDGTPGENDMPGRLVFLTTADGASSPTERMRITQDGKVGIGTTPGEALDLSGAAQNIRIQDGSHIQASSSNEKIVFGADYFSFHTSGSERMRIITDGKVGIGHTTPANILHADVNSAATGTDAISAANRGVSSAGHTTGLRFQFDAAVPAAIRGVLTNATNGAGRLAFFTASDGAVGNLTERLGIRADGTITIPDSINLSFGTSDDLQIQHDGSNSLIVEGGTGSLRICGSIVDIRNAANSEYMARFVQDSSARFYFNDAKKLETASGGVTVTGDLAATSKSFLISHPLDSKKDNYDLRHSSIEGPKADLIYRGKVALVGGSATINIDTVSKMTTGTFVALCQDVQCFTTNETGWIAIKGSVSGNVLTITAQDGSCTDTISWMVVGERQDDSIKASESTDADGHLILEPTKVIDEYTD